MLRNNAMMMTMILIIMMTMILIIMMMMTILIIMIIWKVVQEYERAVIFRLGRLLNGGAKGPGQ